MSSFKENKNDGSPQSGNGEGSTLQSLLHELRENSVALANFSTEQRVLKDKVAELYTFFREEGKGSIITRVSLLENDVGDLKKSGERQERQIDRLSDTSQTFIIEERKDIRENKRQTIQLWIAVITALVGAIVTVITVIYSHH